MSAPVSDLVRAATMSQLLKELTAEVLALTEVVLAMNERLAALEARVTASGTSEQA